MLKSYLFSRSEIDDAAWNRFVDASPQQYLYFYAWYLDVVSPGWSAVVAAQNGQWVAVLPLPLRKKAGLWYAFQPRLTQFLGILFQPLETDWHHRYHFIKTAVAATLQALPAGLFALDLNLHPDLQYFLPFHWQKFEVLPRSTFWLPVDEPFSALEKKFSSSVVNCLKKARKNGIIVERSTSEERLLDIARREKIFNRKEVAVFSSVWAQIRQRQMGYLLYAFTPLGELCSGAAFILDGSRVIFYAIAHESAHKTSGANAMLISEAIRLCCECEETRYFDFEGSMMEGVENFYRSFNPEVKIYFTIRRYRFAWLFKFFRQVAKRVGKWWFQAN